MEGRPDGKLLTRFEKERGIARTDRLWVGFSPKLSPTPTSQPAQTPNTTTRSTCSLDTNPTP